MPFAAQRHSLDFSLPRISNFKVTIYGYSGSQSFVIVLLINFFFVTSTNRQRKGKRNFSFLSNSRFSYRLALSHALSELVEFIFPLPYVLVHLFACFVRVYGYDRVASLWRRVPIPRILDDRVLCGERRIPSFT